MTSESETSKLLQAARENNIDLLRAVKFDCKILDWTVCRHAKSGDSLLHIAAKHGNIITVRFLLEDWSVKNCVSITNQNGKTALHEAAQIADPVIVNYLIIHGADVNSIKGADWTPLMLACTKSGLKALETVNVLLGNGADVKLRNKDGWTAVHVAARDSDIAVMEALLTIDGSLARTRSNNGRTPLHTAVLHGRQDIAEVLIRYCRDTLNAVDVCGVTPLLESVRSGSVELVKYLLNMGASLKQQDAMGFSALHFAAQMGHLQLIMFLVQACCEDINTSSDNTGFTPLHCASRAGQVDAVKLLHSLGANPFCQDKNCRSVSDVAALSCQQEIIAILQEDNESSHNCV